jgi:hypothetical protein
MVTKAGIAQNAGRLALATTAAFLLLGGTAVAQLAFSGNMPVRETGIPFGATGLDSPGLSPAPTGTTGPTGNGTMCLAAGNSSSGAIYDGRGIGMGTSSLVNSATCNATPGNAASSAATLALPSRGGISGVGIPLGSVEISNAGVSPPIAVPTTNSLPLPTTGTGIPCALTGSSMTATSC